MAIPALLAGLIPGLVNKGVELFDKKFVTDAEKQEAIRKYEADAAQALQQAWESEQANITLRHANDMQSDSWLSKNIRPMVLIYLMCLFTLAFFMAVRESVLNMLQDLLMTSFIFYFGARTLEKGAKMFLKK
jgi:cation transport ATPase